MSLIIIETVIAKLSEISETVVVVSKYCNLVRVVMHNNHYLDTDTSFFFNRYEELLIREIPRRGCLLQEEVVMNLLLFCFIL